MARAGDSCKIKVEIHLDGTMFKYSGSIAWRFGRRIRVKWFRFKLLSFLQGVGTRWMDTAGVV